MGNSRRTTCKRSTRCWRADRTCRRPRPLRQRQFRGIRSSAARLAHTPCKALCVGRVVSPIEQQRRASRWWSPESRSFSLCMSSAGGQIGDRVALWIGEGGHGDRCRVTGVAHPACRVPFAGLEVELVPHRNLIRSLRRKVQGCAACMAEKARPSPRTPQTPNCSSCETC